MTTMRSDFEAEIRIFAFEEGGRMTPAANGIRWDFGYADDPPGSEIFMIHPWFMDSNGNDLPHGTWLPTGQLLNARMTVGFDLMREKIHRARIRPGIEFYCQEGAKRVAIGRVTRITGLFKARQP